MKLTKTQQNKIINHARELFIEETAGWIKEKSIGKVGISPSGALQWKNILAWGVTREETMLKSSLEKYLRETLGLNIFCSVLLMKDGFGVYTDGIEMHTTILNHKEETIFEHREKVIEFKDRIVHKVLAN
jgi:hypothetical protein